MKNIILCFDIPVQKNALRIRIWRWLQKVGAEQKMRSYWTLPFSEKNLADFKSICKEIVQNGGAAEVIVGEIYVTK
jgi:hypothetical protein